ncbi:MAG: SgcJ/EcaC family oxidoreductase [Chloroflexi bacterium]|nr:SgcJ/EcaC family oxidoreductase [Chloroflexota bacterium]
MNSTPNEVAQMIRRQQEAWNRGDAAGYAADCDEQMSFTNLIGKTFFGREVFEERHAFLFGSIFKGSRLEMDIRRIHFPAPNVALVDVACTLAGYQRLPEGAAPQSDGLLHTCLLEVLVRAESGWRVAAYHNVDVKKG